MKTVLIPPILDWGFLRQLPQQMASQFAKNGYQVHFCNSSEKSDNVEEVEPNLFVYSNWGTVYDKIAEGKLKIDILYNTWAKHEGWVDFLKPKVTIYHSCDIFEEWKPYEEIMLKKSDIVLCTSQYIYDIRKKQHDNVHLSRNACTSEFIDSTTKMPEDMHFIKSPIFLFAGAIGNWVSTYLIRRVAKEYPTVFIGKEFGKQAPSNIINLGVKNHKDLIHYYAHADVGLLPFNTRSEITHAANPIKIWEYLSCGLPILATSWQETELEEFKGVVFTAKDDAEFVELAHGLAVLGTDYKRSIEEKAIAIARQNTWEKRFEEIEKLIKQSGG